MSNGPLRSNIDKNDNDSISNQNDKKYNNNSFNDNNNSGSGMFNLFVLRGSEAFGGGSVSKCPSTPGGSAKEGLHVRRGSELASY